MKAKSDPWPRDDETQAAALAQAWRQAASTVGNAGARARSAGTATAASWSDPAGATLAGQVGKHVSAKSSMSTTVVTYSQVYDSIPPGLPFDPGRWLVVEWVNHLVEETVANTKKLLHVQPLPSTGTEYDGKFKPLEGKVTGEVGHKDDGYTFTTPDGSVTFEERNWQTAKLEGGLEITKHGVSLSLGVTWGRPCRRRRPSC